MLTSEILSHTLFIFIAKTDFPKFWTHKPQKEKIKNRKAEQKKWGPRYRFVNTYDLLFVWWRFLWNGSFYSFYIALSFWSHWKMSTFKYTLKRMSTFHCDPNEVIVLLRILGFHPQEIECATKFLFTRLFELCSVNMGTSLPITIWNFFPILEAKAMEKSNKAIFKWAFCVHTILPLIMPNLVLFLSPSTPINILGGPSLSLCMYTSAEKHHQLGNPTFTLANPCLCIQISLDCILMP